MSLNAERIHKKLNATSEDKWFHCETSSDCKFLIAPCNVPIAFNKLYEINISKFMGSLSINDKMCVDYMGHPFPDQAICNKSRCDLVYGKVKKGN